MAERYEVAIKVVSQKGNCAAGHKLGHEWTTTGRTPAGICNNAFETLLPNIQILAYGGSLPWEPDPEAIHVCCSDAKNPVIFQLRRVRKQA